MRGVNIDMHEGLVSRAEMMGWPKDLKLMMYNEFNCVLICHDCNINHPPKRETVFKEMRERYGAEFVKWYESISGLTKGKLKGFA